MTGADPIRTQGFQSVETGSQMTGVLPHQGQAWHIASPPHIHGDRKPASGSLHRGTLPGRSQSLFVRLWFFICDPHPTFALSRDCQLPHHLDMTGFGRWLIRCSLRISGRRRCGPCSGASWNAGATGCAARGIRTSPPSSTGRRLKTEIDARVCAPDGPWHGLNPDRKPACTETTGRPATNINEIETALQKFDRAFSRCG